MRRDGRQADETRVTKITRQYTKNAPGSVLVEFGQTRVLCTASLELDIPPFLVGKGRGWLTAEYMMLPGSTLPRKKRDSAGKPDGRSVEIQRLIGRSLRNVVDLTVIPDRTLWIDCMVLDADGGTRTAAITGAFVAAFDAIRNSPFHASLAAFFRDSVAALSVGIVDGTVVLDLDYSEDSRAGVDMNIVMTGTGRFIEIQGAGETVSFTEEEMTTMLSLARSGLRKLTDLQQQALGVPWPWARDP